MSGEFDDKSVASSSSPGLVGAKKRSTVKHAFVLNPDSPRTIEACMELGINPADLKQKTPESFFDPDVDEDIVKLRYNHYTNRYNQTVREVTAKRKELIKLRHHQVPQNILDSQQGHDKITGRAQNSGSFTNLNISHNNEAPNTSYRHAFRSSLNLSTRSLVPTSLLANYHKTVSYLRNSQGALSIKNPDELNIQIDEDTKPFDIQLKQEIEKYNSMKIMKQKEALRMYEDDLRRIRMTEDIKERIKKKEELERKIRKERQRALSEKRESVAEKMHSLKAREKDFNQKMRQLEEKMKKKLEEKKLKLEQEQDEKTRSMMEHEHRIAEKKRKADEIRLRNEKEIEQHVEMLDQKLRDKMVESQEKHEQVLNDKIETIRFKMQKLSEKVASIHEQRVKREEDFIDELVHKVKVKEKKIREFERKQEKEEKERLLRIKNRDDAFKGNKKKLRSDERTRVSNLEEKQKKAEERIQQQKDEGLKQISLKQEMHQLKVFDNQENYERKRRMVEYEQSRTLERERSMAEKIQLLRTQKDIIQMARLESSVRAKAERERLTEAMINLSKKVRLAGTKKFEDLESSIEEKKSEIPQQQQLQQSQILNPGEVQQSPLSKVDKKLKKVNEQGLRLLSAVIPIGQPELSKIENIITGHESLRSKKVGSLSLSRNNNSAINLNKVY